MNLSKLLNPEQAKAAEKIYGPCLIIAGAGSGKTRMITYKIANMLDHGIDESNILALTFTNKAAKEMSERVKSVTGKSL
ncbi:MAG: UvrD-helicase domain-containing protein, partial [Spirochaetales bacterium]|nr:UvrD-helicase domain-containing protein [Spirochaetales bacterium]